MTTVRTTSIAEGVLLVTLDKPPANAIDETLMADLSAVVTAAREDDRIRALVLTGTGRFFCPGFDFSAPRRDDDVALDLYRLYRDCHLALLSLPKPTIAWINGHATAGGFVLALACDHRIATAGDYRIGMNEIAVGASFPRAAMEIVRLRLTDAQSSRLILGAELLPMAVAVDVGLAGTIVDAAVAESRVRELAVRLAAFPRESYAHSKLGLISDACARIAAETDEEGLAAMAVWISEESRAARRRVRERLEGKR